MIYLTAAWGRPWFYLPSLSLWLFGTIRNSCFVLLLLLFLPGSFIVVSDVLFLVILANNTLVYRAFPSFFILSIKKGMLLPCCAYVCVLLSMLTLDNHNGNNWRRQRWESINVKTSWWVREWERGKVVTGLTVFDAFALRLDIKNIHTHA